MSEKIKKKFTVPAADNLEFEFDDVTAEDMDEFFEGSRLNSSAKLAPVLAKTVVKCPADWGDPKDKETFRKLPYFSHFKKLMEIFANEANGKN